MVKLPELVTDRRAGVGPLVALALPMLIGAGALAVDVGSAGLEARRLQGIADAAALSAAGALSRADAAAAESVAASGWTRATDRSVVTGRYSAAAGTPIDRRFTAGATPANAVEVALEARTPAYLARLWGVREVAVRRTARAARIDLAAFAVGSTLASLDGGIVNAWLSALTGSRISLSLLDRGSLAGAQVDLLGYLGALRVRTGAGDNAALLGQPVPLADAVRALADTAADPAAAAALRLIAAQLPGDATALLDTLIALGPVGASDRSGIPVAVDSLSLLLALLQHGAGDEVIELDLGTVLPGIADAHVRVALGGRDEASPWIAIDEAGGVTVRTAQARVQATVALGATSLPLVGTLARVEVPLYVELARGEARLAAIDCPAGGPRGVTLEAKPGLATVAIGSVDARRLGDFTRALSIGTARLVDTPLIDVDARGVIDIGAAEGWTPVRFTEADIAGGVWRKVASSRPVGGIAASLVRQTELTPRVIGLPLPTGPLLGAVGNTLSVASPAIDQLLMLVTGVAGVSLGEASVTVKGMRCGQPVLVG